MHFVLYRYCCEGRYFLNIHLKCLEKLRKSYGKIREFDTDWRVATLCVVAVPALDSDIHMCRLFIECAS